MPRLACVERLFMKISFEIINVSQLANESVDFKMLIFKFDLGSSLDLNNARDLGIFFETLIRGGVLKILVNMRGIEYIDSAGIAVLINSAKQMKTVNGSIVLANVPNDIKALFKTINLQKFMKIFNLEAEAVDFFRYV